MFYRQLTYRGEPKMIRNITVMFLLILISFLYPVYGFTLDKFSASCSQSPDSAMFQTKTKLQQIIVFSRDQAPVSGFLVGIKSDILTILSSGQKREVARADLIRVIILKNDTDNTASKLGLIMGLYIGNLLVFKAEDQPAAYLTTERNFSSLFLLLYNLGFMGLGGILGHLVDAKSIEEIALDFTNDEQSDLQSWKIIENIFRSDSNIHRIHFSVYSSYMYNLATAQHKSFYKDHTGISIYKEYDIPKSGIKFNLFRRIQITYDLKPDLEIGPTLAFLGEPSFGGGNYWSYDDYASLDEQLESMGYYFSLLYYPFQSAQHKNKIYWNIGLSLGAVDLDYLLHAYFYSYTSESEISKQIVISKQTLSALISSELYFTRTSTVAFGLQADYAFIPRQRIGGIPEIGLPAKKLNFSNGGIGILFKINL